MHSLKGSQLNIKDQTDEYITYNAIREVNQKRLMRSSYVKEVKKKCRLSDGSYRCCMCNGTFKSITLAHVGIPHSIRIKTIMKNNPGMSVADLARIDMAEHTADTTLYVACCRTCNTKLENVVPEPQFLVEPIDAD
jgi:hypothetical protein